MAHDAIRAVAQARAVHARAAQVQPRAASQPGAESSSRARPAQQDPVPFPGFETLLRELVDEQTYPRLHRLAWSAPAEPLSERDEFLFGVDRILDGVQSLIDAPKLYRNASPDPAIADREERRTNEPRKA